MARKPIVKELKNTKLLKEYASWIYCTNCNNTIAYLCYVTYDNFKFDFECNCGSKGSLYISFDETQPVLNNLSLVKVKNRLCCPHDNSALLTIVEKNLKSYHGNITCIQCENCFNL